MKNSRKIAVSVGSIVILIMATLAFVFIPAVGGSTGTDVLSLGKWGKKVIKYDPHNSNGVFMDQYKGIVRFIEQQGGYPKDTLQAKIFESQMMRVAFEAAAVQLASQEEVKAVGFHLSNEVINKALIPLYSDSKGLYSQQIYQNTPEHERVVRRKMVSDALIAQQYTQDIMGTYNNDFGLKTSKKETAFIAAMGKNERSINYVLFSLDSFPAEKIKAYANEHKELFAEHHISLLTFTAEADAKKMLSDLTKKVVTFEEAVVTSSSKVGTDSTGKLFSSYRTDINQIFPESKDLDAVINLPVGEISAVLKTDSGYAIVKCNGAPTPADFNEVDTSTRIFEYMKKYEKTLIEDYLMEEGKKFATDAKREGFENVAEKQDIEQNITNAFSINYGNIDVLPKIPNQENSILSSITRDEEFFKTIFSLKEDTVSEPILIDSQVVVLKIYDKIVKEDYALETIENSYKEMTSLWYPNIAYAMISNVPLPWAQQAYVDFILSNKKFVDTFSVIYKYL